MTNFLALASPLSGVQSALKSQWSRSIEHRSRNMATMREAKKQKKVMKKKTSAHTVATLHVVKREALSKGLAVTGTKDSKACPSGTEHMSIKPCTAGMYIAM